MKVSVNSLNRAVSQSALEAIVSARKFTYKNLFALPGGHNIVDGRFYPFTGSTDSGWWGAVLSDANGYLPSAAVLTVEDRLSAVEFILTGIKGNYPVDFTLTLYLQDEVQKVISIVDNDQESLAYKLPHAYDIDKYVLSITRISVGNDVLKIATASFGFSIHNMMKAAGRIVHGKVEVTYANALASSSQSDITVSDGAHGVVKESISSAAAHQSIKFFKLFSNRLDGTYKVIGEDSDTGWWPKTMPDSSGVYSTPQTLRVEFSSRVLYGLTITYDSSSYPVDFTVTIYSGSTVLFTDTVVGNTQPIYSHNGLLSGVTALQITISKTSAAATPAIVNRIPLVSTRLYEDNELVDISLLEELTYEDAMEKLGGVSANELTVNFNNTDKSFYFNNPDSPIAPYLKRNRKIRAWLGLETEDAETIWFTLGTFWSHNWDIPVGSLIAKVTAFDTLGLLSKYTYVDHYVMRNKSIGELIDMVLTSAKQQISLLEWSIDESLYDIIIPIAWFNYGSYLAALNRIAECDALSIYCDRDGRIVARARLNEIQAADDVWSDSTNIIDKSYPTLYTDPPNYIDVKIARVATSTDLVLNVVDLNETVTAGRVGLFNFSSPVESLTTVDIVSTATYTYEWFSWGLLITFTSDGILSSISATGSTLTVDSPTSYHLQDDDRIHEDGAISCEVSSDFIQTLSHASRVAQYLFDKLSYSTYDVEVTYRGDMALTLNNKISLPEGIAPDNLYYIKRHELYYNGSLSGTAKLST